MAAAVVTYRPGLGMTAFSEGRYVTDGSPVATNINCGFVPSRVEIVNASDLDASAVWTSDMANGTAIDDTGAAIASNGITPVAQTDGVNHGFLVGTSTVINEASKTFTWRAYR